MHELKANEELQSLKGIFVPMKPETVEGLEHIRLRQVSRAFAKRIILPNL